jgi:hypothetical protein
MAVYVVVAFAIVFAIAAVVVGREARRLAGQPPKPTFDMGEAVEWVARHLPFDVSAVLSYDDVRRIIDWHLEFLRSKGVSSNGKAPSSEGPVVVGGAETVAYVLERAEVTGSEYTAEQVHAVLDAQMTYLEAIGAIGPVAGPEGRPPTA